MVVRGRIVEPARSRNTTRTIFQQQRRSSSPSDTPSLSFRQMLAKKMRAHTHTSAKLRVHHKAAHEPEDSPLVGQGRKGDRHQHLHEVASCRVTSLQFSAATLFACTGLPDSKSQRAHFEDLEEMLALMVAEAETLHCGCCQPTARFLFLNFAGSAGLSAT